MDRFHIIEDAAVIVRKRGIFRQAKVYHRGNGIYASYYGGYVRLYANGGTGMPDLSWDEIDLGSDRQPFVDVHGKMFLEKPRLKAIA